jgi:hypothetical protein
MLLVFVLVVVMVVVVVVACKCCCLSIQIQASLMQGAEAGEGLTRLQMQLATSKALLAGNRDGNFLSDW